MESKDLFSILIGRLLPKSLKLSKTYAYLFNLDEKCFYSIKEKEDPLSNACIKNIKNVYAAIEGFGKDRLENAFINEECNLRRIKADEKYNYVPGDLYDKIKKNVMPELGIQSFQHDSLSRIIEIVLDNKNGNIIDLEKALNEISDNCTGTVFNEKGKDLLNNWNFRNKKKCLKESKLPDFFFVGRENEIADIKIEFQKKNYVILSGESGSGKYSVAVEYARENQAKYTYTVIVDWKESLENTINSISTEDDVFYDNSETPEDKFKRKKEILNNSGNDSKVALLIIYDANKNFNKKEIEEFCSTGKFHLILTTNSLHGAINIEKELNSTKLIKNYKPDWNPAAHKVDIEVLKRISGENIYFLILLLKWLDSHKCNNAGILRSRIIETPSVTIFDNQKIDMTYHNKVVSGTLKEHIERLLQLNEFSEDEMEQLLLLTFMIDGKIILNSVIESCFDKEFIKKIKRQRILKYQQKEKSFSISRLTKLCILSRIDVDYFASHISGLLETNFNNPDFTLEEKMYCVNLFFNSLKNLFCVVKDQDDTIKTMNICASAINNMVIEYYENIILPVALILNSNNTNESEKAVLSERDSISKGFINNLIFSFYRIIKKLKFDYIEPEYIEALKSFLGNNLILIWENLNANNISKAHSFIESEGQFDDFNKCLLAEINLQKAYTSNDKKVFDESVRTLIEPVCRFRNYNVGLRLLLKLLQYRKNIELLKSFYGIIEPYYKAEKNNAAYSYQLFYLVIAANILSAVVYNEFDYSEVKEYLKIFNDGFTSRFYVNLLAVLISINYDKTVISKLIGDLQKYDSFKQSETFCLVYRYSEEGGSEFANAEWCQAELNRYSNIFRSIGEEGIKYADNTDKIILSYNKMKKQGNVPADSICDMVLYTGDYGKDKFPI
ncbi:MAG: ATP-binding protein [Porcipelethomonas sp.]